MAPGSRASSGAAVALVALTCVGASGARAGAHRLDEYLQAARIAVDIARVEVELDLTPGTSVAESVLATIDTDRDGRLTPHERSAYATAVLKAVRFDLDGHPLTLQAIVSSFPDLATLRNGEGMIRIRTASDLPRLENGAHHLAFRNSHRQDISQYLANALVPESARVVITAQRRNVSQSRLAIDFIVRGK